MQHTVFLGKISDDPATGKRQLFDEGWSRKDLFGTGGRRGAVQINNLQVGRLFFEVFPANRFDIGHGTERQAGRPGYIQPKPNPGIVPAWIYLSSG
jgi:hypothetical protein